MYWLNFFIVVKCIKHFFNHFKMYNSGYLVHSKIYATSTAIWFFNIFIILKWHPIMIKQSFPIFLFFKPSEIKTTFCINRFVHSAYLINMKSLCGLYLDFVITLMRKKHNNFQPEPLSVWTLHILPTYVWVFYGYSGFLPHPKYVHIRVIAVS